jgi:DNA-binding LacI/PurR family transcriptional regulator
MKTPKSLTIYDISRLAEVSVTTVSRALNAETQHLVAPETYERIQQTIRKHHYTPSKAARNLRAGAFRTIGVLLPHFKGIFFSDYYVRILAGIADVLFESDYTFKLLMPKQGQATNWDYYDFKTGEGVDGLLISHWSWCFSNLSVFERSTVPCVVINDPDERIRVPFVCGDNRLGGMLAARHLYDAGHRRIAILTGPVDSNDSRLRVEGFKGFLAQAGQAVDVTVLPGAFLQEQAREQATALLRERREISAIFCCNDNMAFGVFSALRELGLSCPKDVSVVGYDDEPRAALADPPLTTIRVPLYDIARAGAERLLKYLKKQVSREAFYQPTMFPVTLVERGSVRPIR